MASEGHDFLKGVSELNVQIVKNTDRQIDDL
jgi:hypothetical protein